MADGKHARPIPCANHRPVQHRDGMPPWCRACGLTADGTTPTGRLDRAGPAEEGGDEARDEARLRHNRTIADAHYAYEMRAELAEARAAVARVEALRLEWDSGSNPILHVAAGAAPSGPRPRRTLSRPPGDRER